MTVLSFKKGSVIFRENSWELSMYDVVSGKVGIYSGYGTENETLLTQLEKGRYFGEMGLIDAMPRSATAVALEDCEVNLIKVEDFDSFIEKDPEKIFEIFQNLCGRLRELSNEYIDACETAAQYVEAYEENKPQKKGLIQKIKKIMEVSNKYSEMLNEIYSETNAFYPINYYHYY